MPLEPDFDFIDDLDSANPVTDDEVNEGDNHIRGVKNALQGNVRGDALTTALLQAGVDALSVDDKGAQVVGHVTVTDPAPLNPDELTRMDYVDALSVDAGAGLVGGGPVVGNPSLDVGAGNGIAVGADDVSMSGDFTGQLDVTGDVTGNGQVLESVAGSDAGDAALQAQINEILGGQVGGQDRLQIGTSQVLAGLQVPAGQAITVTFAVPFDQLPAVTLTLHNPSNANNGFAYLNTITNTGFTGTVGVSGQTVHWQAIGRTAN